MKAAILLALYILLPSGQVDVDAFYYAPQACERDAASLLDGTGDDEVAMAWCAPAGTYPVPPNPTGIQQLPPSPAVIESPGP